MDHRILWRGPLPPHRVEARTVPSQWRPTPAERRIIDESWEAARVRAGRESRSLFDGELLRLERWSASERGLRLEVSPVRYRAFLATQLRPEPALLPLRPGLRADPVGTSALVRSADGRRAWLGRRSPQVSHHAGRVHAFGGVLETADAGADGAVDVGSSMLRELEEELGLRAEHLAELRLLGLVEDRTLAQPELVFEARLAEGAEERLARWREASSAAEHAELVEFPVSRLDPERFPETCPDAIPVVRALVQILWEEIRE